MICKETPKGRKVVTACWSVVVTLSVARGRTAGWGLGEQAAWYSTLCWWPTRAWGTSCMVFHSVLVTHSTNIPQTAGARKCVEGVSKATDGIWLCKHLLAGTLCNHLSACTIKFLFYSNLYLVCLTSLTLLPAFLPLNFLLYMTSDRKLGRGLEARLSFSHSPVSCALLTNGLAECGCVCLWIRRDWTKRAKKVLGHDLLRVWTPLSRVSHNLRVTTTIMLLWWWCCYGDDVAMVINISLL